MTAGEIRKLVEGLPDEAPVRFTLGDCDSPLKEWEIWTTTTKDAAFVEFVPPDNWRKE